MADDLEKILKILVRFGVDPAGIKTVDDANKKLADTLKSTRTELQSTSMSWREFVAANMSEQMKLTGSHGAAMKAIGEQWRALKGEMQATGAEQQKTIGATQQANQRLAASFQKSRAELHALRQDARELGEVGRTLTELGAVLTGPIALSAALYIKNAGQAEAVSRQWLSTTKQIGEQQQRIGRVSAEAILPLLQTALKVETAIAGFVEAHPDLVKTVFTVGTLVAAAGVLTTLVARGIRMVADVKLLLLGTQQQQAAALMNVAADKQLAAATTMTQAAGAQAAAGGTTVAGGAAAGGLAALAGRVLPIAAITVAGVGIGAWIGQQIAHALGRATFGETEQAANRLKDAIAKLPLDVAKQKMAELAQQLQGLSEPQQVERINAFVDGLESATQATDNLTVSLDKFTERERIATFAMLSGVAGQVEQAGQQLGGAFGGVVRGFGMIAQSGLTDVIRNDPAIRAYEDYQKKIKQIEKQYDDERTKIITDALKQSSQAARQFDSEMQKAAANFARSQSQAARDFQRSQVKDALTFARDEAKSESQYYASRLQQAARFGLEMQRMEEEHQVQIQRLTQDHTRNLRKLADQRDALGIEDEMDRYNTERQRAEEDYQRNVAARNQDYALQLADQEQAFQQQRVEALANFKQQQQDARDSFTEQQKQRKADFDAQQVERAKQFQDEAKRRIADGNQRLDDLKTQNAQQRVETYNDFTQREAELGVFIGIQAAQWQNYYSLLATGLQNLITGAQQKFTAIPTLTPVISPMPIPRYQAGGYALPGRAILDANEFVMNANTTRRAEAAIGDRLSQEKIVAALNRPTAGALTLQANVKIDQSFGSVSDPAEIERLTQDAAYEAVMKVGEKLRSVMGARV